MPETYYDVLGITRKVSKDELAHAFLAQSLKSHPERHPNNPVAERRFALVAEAFCVLCDAKLRFGYDRVLKETPDQPMRVPLELESAHIVLNDMLKQFVENRLSESAAPEQIYDELVEQHQCPPELGNVVLTAGIDIRKTRVRAAGLKMLWHGLAVFAIGSVITIVSLMESSPGGAFLFWYGPIAYGAGHTAVALWYLEQGKEPPLLYSLGTSDEVTWKGRKSRIRAQ
jgi:hypothetical protein